MLLVFFTFSRVLRISTRLSTLDRYFPYCPHPVLRQGGGQEGPYDRGADDKGPKLAMPFLLVE
eukprot:9452427-Pyramimonas_sp.AAC.1